MYDTGGSKDEVRQKILAFLHRSRDINNIEHDPTNHPAIAAFIEDQAQKISEGVVSLTQQAVLPEEFITHEVHNNPSWRPVHDDLGHQMAVELFQLEMVAVNFALAFGEERAGEIFMGLGQYVQSGRLNLPSRDTLEMMTAAVPDDLTELDNTEGTTDGT